MLQIFKPLSLIKNLPNLNIECMTAHDDCIILVTKQGHLMRWKFSRKKYTLTSSSTASSSSSSSSQQEFDLDLIKSHKQFTKKPVTHLVTVAELKLIVTLCDGLVHVNSLDDLSNIQVIQKYKGASLFDTNLKSQLTLTGEFQYVLRLCIVVKRKVILLYWKNKNFHEMGKEIQLKDQPLSVAWFSESLFIGYKSEYTIIKLNHQNTIDRSEETRIISTTGNKQQEPLIRCIGPDKFSVNKDESTYIFNHIGERYFNQCISWSDIPLNLTENYPYLVALLPSSIIEVRTPEPHLFIQRLELAQLTSNYSKVKILTKCARRKGLLFAASTSDIFAIVSIPVEQQRAQMVSEKHYEIALNLAKSIDNHRSDDHDDGIRNLELQYAHDLFQREQYIEALELFMKLDLSPLLVIDLFPELGDSNFTQQSSSDSRHLLAANATNNTRPQTPKLAETNDRLSAMIDYLLNVRRKINKAKQSMNSCQDGHSRNVDSPTFVSLDQDVNNTFQNHLISPRALERLKQEVDTTLLKCYLKTNIQLVASLLRLPDNSCELQLTEKALMKYNRHNELIILYKSRGLHRKSLDLLKNQHRDYPMFGVEKTVQYLQDLGYEHIEIIFEHAKWIFEESSDLGLKIFTADQQETEQLDRTLVLEFLQHTAPQAVIPYLEHVIFVWNDVTALFHNTLLAKYRQRVAMLLTEYIDSLDGATPCTAGQEPGELGELRRKLLDFLEISDYYTIDGLPSLLLNQGLCEERAIVVGKLGQHEEALSIFIHVLDNPKRAEEYCETVYRKKGLNSKNIFLLLLKLYLHPPPDLNSTNLRQLITRNKSLISLSNSHIIESSDNTDNCGRDDVVIENSTIESPNEHNSISDFTQRIVKLLTEHGDKIDPIAALESLPGEVKLSSLREYIGSTFERNFEQVRQAEECRQEVLKEFYSAQKEWINLQRGEMILIEDTTICKVCTKKIGRSAFVKFSNSDLVHYSCKDYYGKTQNAKKLSISSTITNRRIP